MYCTPAGPLPLEPVTQNAVPSAEVALRALFLLKAELMIVVVSTLPIASTRVTTRLTLPAALPTVVVLTAATPGAAAYPASVKYFPFAESERAPSDVDVPERVKGWLLPA